MKRHKIKRSRPTLETAHSWLKDGLFLTDPQKHYLSDQELQDQMQNMISEVESTVRQFPRTQNLEFAILKAHLIIEHIIAQFISFHARVAVNASEIGFTFFQKLEIAYLLGFGANSPIVLPSVQLLNKARNQVAHGFALDRKAINELIKINNSLADPTKIETDTDRIRGLRHFCRFLSAYTLGRLEAEFYMSQSEYRIASTQSPPG